MVGKLILRGIILGIVAGILAFGFAKIVAEPVIGQAISYESSKDDAERAAMVAKGETPPAEEADPFSRDVQSGVGIATGILGVGAGIGAFFAILFAFGNGRMGNLGPKPTAAVIALMGLITIYVVPALKYPANPPAVGQEDTIKLRTGLYFLMIALSIASTMGALFVRKTLAPKQGGWNASLIAAAFYVVVLAIAFAILPSINEVPADFSAVMLWKFRLDSLTTQIILWGATGILFGYFNGLSSQQRVPNGRTATA